MLEQRPCQEAFALQNNHLRACARPKQGDGNCQVVTAARRLRHQQAALGMLFELAAEPASGGLTRNAGLQPVQPPP